MYQNIYITDWEPGAPPIVHLWDDEKGYQKKLYREFEYAYQRSTTGKYMSMYGEPLAKITGRTKDIPGLYESDVNRETRVLTDLYLHSDEPSKNHRTLFFDIEVETDGTFPDMMRADKAITAMSMHYKELDEYRVWILDPDMKLDNQVRDNIHIVSCRTELELIEGFLDYYSDVKPTIISGWNSDWFDIPYIIRRLENRYGKPYAAMLSPIKKYKFSEHRQRYVLAGVASLDYMNVYKKFASSQKASYRLDAISKDEVGVGKIEYEGSLDDLYANDIEKFLEYSIHDVRLLRMLDDKLRYLELIRAICHMGHVPYEDYAYSSRFIEGTILTFLHRKGIIASNKPAGGAEAFAQKLEDDKEGFVGAYVKPPKPEVYPWVYSLDLQSLYPSIIMSLNISPETKIGIVRNWNVDAYHKKQLREIEVDLPDGRSVMSPEDFAAWIETNQYAISSNGILYRQDVVGIIPEILDKWFAARAEFKGLMKKYTKEGNQELADYYDRRQYAQKILLNCFSPDHDVVTPTGIRNITDLQVGDLVYSINPETGFAEIKPVTRTFEYDYEGDMVEFKSAHVDFLTTPNHRFLMSDANDTERHYRWVLSGDVMAMGTRQYLPMKRPLPGVVKHNTISLSDWYTGNVVAEGDAIRDDRVRTKYHPNTFQMDDWLEFMGWYISEGSLYMSSHKKFSSGNVRGECYSVFIAQEKHHAHVKSLLDRMGLEYYENNKGFKIVSKILHDVLLDMCGKYSHQKSMPRWVFELFPDQLHHLYRGLMMGDGNANGQRYRTKSPQLAYDVTELALRLGYQAFIAKSRDIHSVQINGSRGIRPCIKPENKSLVPYRGKVYCVEVADNHTLLCGRNGRYNWCGQSIYGVLGLSIFRFYDLDNALAVTSVGQDVIKTTAKYVNMQYKKRNVPNKTQEWMDSYQQWLSLWGETGVPSPDDHCVYIDTDSVYFSADPFLTETMTFDERKAETIRIAYEFEEGINKFYTPMAKKLFNCLNHRFVIKGESVMQTAFWMRKKRYAMLKVYDLETKQDIDFKVAVKGLDVVRSSFPPAFQKFMKGILRNILDRRAKEHVDQEVLQFRQDMLSLSYMDVAKNTSVKNITKYLKDMPPEAKYDYTVFVSGTPAHVKAAMTYNRMLEHFGIHHQYTPIRDGDKIKWVKLKKNPLGIATLALKTYDDPPQLVEIVEQYMDYERLYEDELENKLADFYTALGWGKLPVPVNTNVSSIFAYED